MVATYVDTLKRLAHPHVYITETSFGQANNEITAGGKCTVFT